MSDSETSFGRSFAGRIAIGLIVVVVGAVIIARFGLGYGAARTWTNSLGMKFVRIEPGEFLMGSPASEDGHEPNEVQHKVKLTRPFLMATTEVTQAQWKAVMGNNPSNFKGDDLPVEQVSWDEAVEFCRKLGEKEGKRYRLPTEAEWEYACRAGTRTAYYTGADERALAEAGWYVGNANKATHPVGQKKPNAWGLYDMHGNVWEWCSDGYGNYHQGDVTDPTGADSAASRVLRGGSWSDGPQGCRSASRFRFAPDRRDGGIGFRVCLDFE